MLRDVIRDVIRDAFDSKPAELMICPYCGERADRVGGPLYFWKCSECRAFGTTWEWQKAHGRKVRELLRKGGA